jgi:predicted nucleotidyltransferase
MIEYDRVLPLLVQGGVEFIAVGGTAANIHGSPRITSDLDILYRRTKDNIQRLVATLAPLNPYLRGAPRGLPFHWDEAMIRGGLNFTLVTDGGDLDLLGDMKGAGTYEDVLPRSEEITFRGVVFRVVDLETLIRAKRAAARPKDFEAIAELEAIREEREK